MTTTELRIDAVEIKTARIDDQGFMQVGGVIARTGVQEYLIDGQIVRELRPETEVIKSAKTFVRKPMTLNHPPVFVTADNTESYMKGMTSTVTYQDGLLIDPEMTISHQDAIDASLTSHKQLSAGYLVEVKPESGVWIDKNGVQGEKGAEYAYDAVQTNIIGNHVALVEQARAGKIASLKFDGMDNVRVGYSTRTDESKITIDNNLDIETMTDIKTDATDKWLERLDAAKAELTELTSKFDALNSEMETLRAENGELKGKVDAYETKVSELEAQVKEATDSKMTDEQIASEVANRVSMWSLVSPHLDGVEVDYSKSELEIKKLFLATKVDSEKVANASEDMIAGMWTVLAPKADEAPAKEDSKTEAQAETLDSMHGVEVQSNEDVALNTKAIRDAHKKIAEDLAANRLFF